MPLVPLSFLLVLLALLTRHIIDASPEFQARLPNGGNVMVDGQPWPAVGHGAPMGDATFNPFGVAFKQAKLQWTVELCQMDSDGDGMTNGEELGDPDCIWQPGATPTRTIDITHPGFVNTDAGSSSSSSSTSGGENGTTTTTSDGTTTSPQQEQQQVPQYSLPTWLVVHIVCMTLSWGFFLPIGALMAISFRGKFSSINGEGGTALWFRLHVSIQIIGLILSIIGFTIPMINIEQHFKGTHQIFGTVIFGMGLFQAIQGMVRPKKSHNPNDGPTLVRKIWEVCHKGFGKIVIILAWANIFLGIKLVKNFFSSLPSELTSTIYIGMNALLGIQAGLCLLLTATAIFYRSKDNNNNSLKDGRDTDTAAVAVEIGKDTNESMNHTGRTKLVVDDLEDQVP